MAKLTERVAINSADISDDDLIHIVHDAGGTPISYKMTVAQLKTFISAITGSGVDNQIAVYNGTDTIEGDTSLTWDGNTITVTGDASNKAQLKLDSDSNQNALVTLNTNGGSANSLVQFQISDLTKYMIGINGEDSDATNEMFIITNGDSFDDDGIIVMKPNGNVGIGLGNSAEPSANKLEIGASDTTNASLKIREQSGTPTTPESGQMRNDAGSPMWYDGTQWVDLAGGGGASFGTNDQIPFTNSSSDDYDYDSKLTYNSTTLFVDSTANNSPAIQVDRTSGTNKTKIFGGWISGDLDGVNWQVYRGGSSAVVFQSTNSKNVVLGTNSTGGLGTGKVFNLRTTGDIDIGQAYNDTTIGARVGIKGSGTTSATSSLKCVNSAGTTTFEVTDDGSITANGLGDVTKVGTPANNQVAIWTGNGTLEGESAWTYDSNTFRSYIQSDFARLGTKNGAGTRYIEMRSTSPQLYIVDGANTTQYFYNTITTGAGQDFKIQASGSGSTYTYFDSDGSVGINAGNSLDARLHVKGAGSDNTTSALLVKNSSNTSLLEVKDNGVINASNLPTSSAGLSSGDIYNDGGTLKIV